LMQNSDPHLIAAIFVWGDKITMDPSW